MAILFKTIFIYCVFIISLLNLIPAAQSQDPTTSLADEVAYLKSQLTTQYKLSNDLLKANGDLLSAVGELQETVASLQRRLTAQTTKSDSSIEILQKKMTEQSNKQSTDAGRLTSQLGELSKSSSSDVADLKLQLQNVLDLPMIKMSLGKAISGPIPSGCSDVKSLGWILNGFYTVKGINGTKVNTVYCDFTKTIGIAGYETAIGFNDVKTASGVYFDVSRKSSFSLSGRVIPYDVNRLNIGEAMDLASGVFTAPVSGRYQFSFIGRSNSGNENRVTIRVNDKDVTLAFQMSAGFNMPLVTTLNLKMGDKVDTYLFTGTLFDNAAGHTKYTGVLLEEDLIL